MRVVVRVGGVRSGGVYSRQTSWLSRCRTLVSAALALCVSALCSATTRFKWPHRLPAVRLQPPPPPTRPPPSTSSVRGEEKSIKISTWSKRLPKSRLHMQSFRAIDDWRAVRGSLIHAIDFLPTVATKSVLAQRNRAASSESYSGLMCTSRPSRAVSTLLRSDHQ